MADRRFVERVPASLGGERLDRVAAFVTGASRAQARRWIEAGAVTVDGEVAPQASVRLVEGAVVEIVAVDEQQDVLVPDPTIALTVVHADEDVVVVDKQAGLVVHPGAGRHSGTLVNALLARFPDMAGVGEPHRPGVVHRLDRGTSGLMVLARTDAAHRTLVADLAARLVTRRYLALVSGRPATPMGRIDAPIGRHPHRRTRMAVVASGRPARTSFETVTAFAQPVEATLLSCTLDTGRTHQIRVHLASIGLPVVGDRTYGRADLLGARRPFLHAAELAFRHPVTGVPLRFTSDLPADLVAVLGELDPPGPE